MKSNDDPSETSNFNITLNQPFLPLVCSTEVKAKSGSGNNRQVNEHVDSFYCADYDVGNNEIVPDSQCDISPKYLKRSEQPNIYVCRDNTWDEDLIDKTPCFDKTTKNKMKTFVKGQHSETICNLAHVVSDNSQAFSSYLANNVVSNGIDDDDDDQKENVNSPTSHSNTLDNIVANMTLSKPVNMMKVIKAFTHNEEESQDHSMEAARENVPLQEAYVDHENICICSNKMALLWVGVNARSDEIKSFKLNLQSTISRIVNLSINQNSSSFCFTNQSGNTPSHTRQETLYPNIDKKFYIQFHPNNSNYQHGIIRIEVSGRRYKIHLFGYSEPARIELRKFSKHNDQANPSSDKYMLVVPTDGSYRGRVSFTLFNSGGRTAFVGFYSSSKQVTFEPRMFLLVPKSEKEVMAIIHNNDSKVLDFFMVSVDEDLRRAARTKWFGMSSTTDGNYKIFDQLQLFVRLFDERNVCLPDLPGHDWLPYLRRQINDNFVSCTFCFVSADQLHRSPLNSIADNDSVSTVDLKSHISSVTGRSSLSVLENHTQFQQYLSDVATSGVFVSNGCEFPRTPIGHRSYLGILIRNCTAFTVQWRTTDMSYSYHNLLNPSSSSSPISDSTSLLSLGGIGDSQQSDMRIVAAREGFLEPMAAVVIPVEYRPRYHGIVECVCSVTVINRTDGTILCDSKTVLFRGEGRKVSESGLSIDYPRIQNVSITPRSLEFSGLSDTKQISFKNCSQHSKDLFFSQLSPPFQMSRSQLTINMKTKCFLDICTKGSYNREVTKDVLVIADSEGMCTSVVLNIAAAVD